MRYSTEIKDRWITGNWGEDGEYDCSEREYERDGDAEYEYRRDMMLDEKV